LGYAGEREGKGRTADALAFQRDVLDFSNCLLVEQPNGDFAQTIVRHFLFATWQQLYLGALCDSSDPQLSAIAQKAVKEVAYHARLAAEWVERLGDGTDESHNRTVTAFDWMWRFVDELFVMDETDDVLVSIGAGVDKARLRPAWDANIDRVLAAATLTRPAARRSIWGGRSGKHSEHLGHLLSDMQFLQRAYPGASW